MNCQAVLYGAFCSQCGQQETQPLTFARFFAESRRRLRHLDFTWPRTLSALTTDPGRMVRRYLAGRRKPYVPPLLYSLATTTLLAFAVLAVLEKGLVSKLSPWSFDPGGSLTAAVALAVYGGLAATLGVAWLQRSLHNEAAHGLLETWIFGLYVFGHLALFQAFFALIGAFTSALGLIALALAVLLVLTFALAGFYRQPIMRAVPAALILGSSYIASLFVVSALVRLALG